MSDNAPTQKLGTVTDGGERQSRTLLYVLIGIGALLLIAVIVLIATLLGSRGAQPTATPTETSSASPTPTPTDTEGTPSPAPSQDEEEPDDEPDPQPVPGFDSFSAPSDAGCQDEDFQRPLSFSWSSDDAVRAYIGVQTDNAKAAPYEGNLPPVYTYTTINYNCDQASQFYTVTLEDGAGHLTHKTVTITK